MPPDDNTSPSPLPETTGLVSQGATLLASPVSCFAGIDPKVLRDVTLEALLARIQSARWRDAILTLRAMRDPQRYKRAKEKLPAFTACGTFTYRDVEHLVQHNGTIHGDIDHLDDPDILTEAK